MRCLEIMRRKRDYKGAKGPVEQSRNRPANSTSAVCMKAFPWYAELNDTGSQPDDYRGQYAEHQRERCVLAGPENGCAADRPFDPSQEDEKRQRTGECKVSQSKYVQWPGGASVLFLGKIGLR